MHIKICGLLREHDIDYINEAKPDYAGFVFAESKRQLSPTQAEHLRSRLAKAIVPVGVFVNSPVKEITALYRNGVISIAQLHGTEDENYIAQLKTECDIPVIKVLIFREQGFLSEGATDNSHAHISNHDPRSPLSDYYLIDSGAGSGKTFDWEMLKQQKMDKPWFLAGGINPDNIQRAMASNPFAIDISSGAETDGFKNREKILQLTTAVKDGMKGNIQ